MSRDKEKVAASMKKCASKGDKQALERIANSTNVNWRDSEGHTALMAASEAGDSKPHAECACLLLTRLEADPNVEDYYGSTALHFAAQSDNVAVIKLLVSSGAGINVQDGSGFTPLMLACCSGSLKAAKELLHFGCDTELRNDDGDTAGSLAKKYECKDFVRLLRKKSQAGQQEQPSRECTFRADEIADDEDEPEMKPEERTMRMVKTQKIREKADVRREKSRLSERVYPVTSPQGHCVVINIDKYDKNSNFSSRDGSHVDVQAVKTLFTALNFKVTVRKNLTGQGIHSELSDFGRIDHTKFGSFVCFLMAHGTQGAIYGRDGRHQSIRDLVELFEPNKCKGLDGKPKIFFVQACRGSEHQVFRSLSKTKVMQQDSVHRDRQVVRSQSRTSGMQQDSVQRDDGNIPVKDPSFVPNKCDFLFCYANTEDSPAYRSPTEGSIFIQTLCKVIDEEREHEDLEGMILEVNNRVSKTPIPGGRNIYYQDVVDKTGRMSKRVSLNPKDAVAL